MKRLIPVLLCLLLLCGCAEVYDGPTELQPMLAEYSVRHYSSSIADTQLRYTERTVYAYDIHGNMVRSMEYRDSELQEVTNLRYDERGNEIRRTAWDRSGWFPEFISCTERTYDDQDRILSSISYNFWGRRESASWYTYDDEERTRFWRSDAGDTQTTWFDEDGRELRQVAGEYETVYQYDSNGNRTGWNSYKNGDAYDRYEESCDDMGRVIWGKYYDASGELRSHLIFDYDDDAHTKTIHRPDGDIRIEYYDADGNLHLIEDYNADGDLTMIQQYTYRDIKVPVKGGATP